MSFYLENDMNTITITKAVKTQNHFLTMPKTVKRFKAVNYFT